MPLLDACTDPQLEERIRTVASCPLQPSDIFLRNEQGPPDDRA
jgi:hypothetical protein